MCLGSLSLELLEHSQWGQGNCPGSVGVVPAFAFLVSWALVSGIQSQHGPPLWRWTIVPCPWHIPWLCFGFRWVNAMLVFTVFVTFSRPALIPFSLESSPKSSSFGILESSIPMIQSVQQNYDFRITASMLVVSALSRTSRFVTLSRHMIFRIDLRLHMWKHFNIFRCFL